MWHMGIGPRTIYLMPPAKLINFDFKYNEADNLK